MKLFNHKRPVRDETGEKVSEQASPVFRATVEALGHGFGPDDKRRLVVGLEAGDIISFRPAKTRQRVTAPARDLYRQVLQWVALRDCLETARARKAAMASQRQRRRIKAAERRLFR